MRILSFSPCVPRPASSPPLAGGGLAYAVLWAALHPRSNLPPPRRVGLRFPTPVGHGRGLASRPGCAGPGEGIDSARRSSMPGERAAPIICLFPGVNRARLRSSPIRITPRCSHTKQSAKRSSHRTRSVGQRSLPKNVPSCDFQLSGLWPGRLRRLSR